MSSQSEEIMEELVGSVLNNVDDVPTSVKVVLNDLMCQDMENEPLRGTGVITLMLYLIGEVTKHKKNLKLLKN